MSLFLDQDLANKALERSRPTIEQILVHNAKREDLYITIGRRDENGSFWRIARDTFGNVNEWDHDYEEIATKKAALTARTGLSSREVQLLHPELLQPGDTSFWGSVISGDVIVAASGVEPYIDEACAKIALAIGLMLIEHKIVYLRTQGDLFS